MPVSVSVVKKDNNVEVMRFDIDQDVTEAGRLSGKLVECIEHAMDHVVRGDRESIIILEYRRNWYEQRTFNTISGIKHGGCVENYSGGAKLRILRSQDRKKRRKTVRDI